MDKQELEELKVSIYENLRQAIREGDKEKALALIDDSNSNREKLNDLYVSWIDLLLTYIDDKLGEEAIYDAVRLFCQRFAVPALEGSFGPINIADRVRKRAYMWTSFHGADIDEIEEDEEKFIFKFKCPSGGSISTKEQCGRTKKAYPWSWGQEGLAYYCIHHPVLDILAIEQFGYPAWVIQTQPKGHCIQYVYKNPESVPEEYYKRVGMEKKTPK